MRESISNILDEVREKLLTAIYIGGEVRVCGRE
jgi:hypothetical protein